MSNKQINLTKRNGTVEPLDVNKIHKVLQWACEGVEDVSVSQIESSARIKFFDLMKTSDVHRALISASHDLISEESPNYDIVAGRLEMFDVRKQAYGDFVTPALYDHVTKMVAEGWYHPELLEMYTKEEWEKIDSYVVHDRDFNFRYSGAREWVDKFLVKDKKSGRIYESPQMAYILIAAILKHKYVKEYGLTEVQNYYNATSTGEVLLPSPVIQGIRTPNPQGASCVLIKVGDSLPSIFASASAAGLYAANKAGLGVGIFSLRAENQPIRKGDAVTTGPIPFGKLMQAATSSCSQGGMRKGSMTLYHNIWHKDVANLLVLKNNKGTEETRIRHSDHAFNCNMYLLKKIAKGEPINLFSPEQVPDLLKAFFDDQEEFARLYEFYSGPKAPKHIAQTVIDGVELRKLIINERNSTTRIYFHFVDNSNGQGSFYPKRAPVEMSNLCTEITLPTVSFESLEDINGLISLCNLSAINWSAIKNASDMERVCREAVRGIDALLDYQPYLLPAARNSTEWYRPLGIGVADLAHFLAKRGLKYDESAFEIVDEWAEMQSYFCLKESLNLSKLYGPCGKRENVRYNNGEFVFERRSKKLDELLPHKTRMDWETLREGFIKYGPRNATVGACMPGETSTKVHNLTNGTEPARKSIVTKRGTKQVVPEFKRLKNKYDYEFDMDLEGYLKVTAFIQKWFDQGMSIQTRYDPTKYPDGMIPATLLFRHIILGAILGHKTFYYQNNKKVLVEKEELPEEPTVEESQEEQEECASCSI